MSSFKVIIAGSRDFDHYRLLKKYCDSMLSNKDKVTIVSGTARGADRLGELYAKSHGHKLKKFPADWNKLGKSAGYVRNKEMAEYADALIAFWDGESRGTKHMIDIANDLKLEVRVLNYKALLNDRRI